MDFDQKKISREEGEKRLRALRVNALQAYALLPTPVYVFMPRNEKYVSVKGPLDFFTPDELTKYSSLGSLFFSNFIEKVVPFRDAGVRVNALLNWQPVRKQETPEGKVVEVPVPPSPFELTDAISHVTGPLWGQAVAIEPFFTAPFVEELCDSLPHEELTFLRDADFDQYERRILGSSIAVFFALHLGWVDLEFLNRLRLTFVRGEDGESADVRSLFQLANAALTEAKIDLAWLNDRPEPVAWKIASRLERVMRVWASKSIPSPSLFGEGGLVIG